jgi:hypothetical protein
MGQGPRLCSRIPLKPRRWRLLPWKGKGKAVPPWKAVVEIWSQKNRVTLSATRRLYSVHRVRR